MPRHPRSGGTNETTRSLLASRDAIRQQMEEEENRRKQAYWQALMEMGSQATNMLGMTMPQAPVLPDRRTEVEVTISDPQPYPRQLAVDPKDPRFMAQQDVTFVPRDQPRPVAEIRSAPYPGQIVELPQVSDEAAARARPGGRAEAFLEGRRAKTGSPEDIARWTGTGRPAGVSEARHRELMGEVWDEEKQMLVPTAERSKLGTAGLVGKGVVEGAADVAFYKTGGALRLTEKFLEGMSDADARQEGALYDFTSGITGGLAKLAGKAAGKFYEQSDIQREDMNRGFYSLLSPGTQIREKPGWQTAGQVGGMMGAEVATYIGGGALVKGALRGAGILGPAMKWVPNRNKHWITQWGSRIADSVKQTGGDVAAFGLVDVVTTQRDIDSAAWMVDQFTSPDFLERYREDPEGFLANHPQIDNMANYLNEVAGKAVETAAGRAAFEMALGGILDLGLRGVVGTVTATGRGVGIVAEPLNQRFLKGPEMARVVEGKAEIRADLERGVLAGRQLELEGIDSGVDPLRGIDDIDPTKVGEAPTIGRRTPGVESELRVARDETQLELEGVIQRTTTENKLDAIDRAVRGVDAEGRASVTPTGRAKTTRALLNNEARAQLGLKEFEVKELGIDPADTEAYSAFLREQAGSLEAPRTPDLRATYDGRNNRPEWMAADREQLKELARRGNARDPLWRRFLGVPKTRKWYSEGNTALAELVPDEEFDQFVKFLATFSQNTDPKTNLIEAVLSWNRVQRGDPIRGVLAGKKAKAKMVLAGEELDTPKIWSFAENLLGDENAVTVDVWMWRMLGDVQPHKDAKTVAHDGLRYAQAREEIRHIARELTEETGQKWTPAQVQAATWVEFRDNWGQALGGKPQNNDSFMDLMDASLTKVAGIERGVREGMTEVVSEAMPSPNAGRIKRMTSGTADVKSRVEYSEARFKVVVPILRKLAKELGIEGDLAGALGVEHPLVKAIRPAQTVADIGKTTIGKGGTWEGQWNSNLPFILPPNTPPSTVKMVAAVMGDLLEQDVVFTSTFRPNKREALAAAKDLPGNPSNLDGELSGVQVVTRKFMGIDAADDLARHFRDIADDPKHPLASALKDVNFTQSGDVLLFTDFSGGAPQKFWETVHQALEGFEGGRFWDEIADVDDMGFARTDGELLGGSYGKGQWDEVFEAARVETSAADEVPGRVAPDFLESQRNSVRKKFDEIDAEFRDRLDGIEREANEVVENTRAPAEPVDSPVDPKKLKGPPDAPPPIDASGVAGKLFVRPEVVGGAAGLAYGAMDPDDPISPFGGAALGVALAGGGTYLARKADIAKRMSESALTQKIVKRLGGKKETVEVASDAEVTAAIAKIKEAETTAGGIQPRPIPKEDLPSVPGPDADDFDANEFVNMGKFGLDPKELESKLAEMVEYIVNTTGLNPKTVFTWAQTKAMAKEFFDLDPEDLAEGLRGQKGRMGEAGARLLAARGVIKANTERVAVLYKQVKEGEKKGLMSPGSEEAKLLETEIAVLEGEVNKLLTDYMPAMSEAGRVLNAAKILAQETMDPGVWMMRASKIAGDPSAIPSSIRTEIVRLTEAKDKAGLIKLLGELNKSGIAEQIVTLGKAGMLSGIPTHMMNLFSTATNVFLEEFKDIPSSLMDRFLVSSTGLASERTKSWGSVKARLSAAALGARDGYLNAVEVMKGNPLIGQAEKWDQAKYQINIDLAQRMFGHVSEKLAEKTPLLRHVPAIPKVLDAGMQAFHKTVFGALGAGDAMLTHFAVRRSLAEQARVQAINSGLRGADIEKRAAEILQNELTPEMMLEAIAQGELSTFRTRGPTARTVVGWKRKLAVRSKDPSGGAGSRFLSGGLFALAEKTAPFVQTPINVALRTTEASPIAAVYAVGEIGGHGIAKMLGLKKGPAYANGAQKEIVETFGRATTGGTMIATGMYLYNQGLLSLGYTPEKRGQRELTGERENSWKMGDEWIGMDRLSPAGNLILLGGYIMRSWQHTGDPDVMNPFAYHKPSYLERVLGVGYGPDGLRWTRDAVLLESAEGAARTLLEQTFAAGVRGLLEGIYGTERLDSRSPWDIRGYAQIAVPNIMRRLDRYMDPTVRVRDERPILDQFKQWKPGSSTDLPPRRDPFGQEISYAPGGAGKLESFYRAMIDPVAMSYSKTENTDGTSNLRGLLRDLDVTVGRRQRGEFETVQEFDARQVSEGADLEMQLSQFIGSRGFRNLASRVKDNEHFIELARSGHLNNENQDRLIPALIKAIQAEAISNEITRIRSAQSALRGAQISGTGGMSTTDVEKFQYQQRLQGPGGR